MTADKFLEVALSQVGYKEYGVNKTKYGEWYGMNGEPWCAIFVSWCANQVGVLDKLIPKYSSSSAGYKWFKKNTGITMTPKPGDIGFIKNSNKEKEKTYPAEHTFIVYSVNGDTISTIEGNIDNRVVKITRKLNDPKILGFGIVNWEQHEIKYVDNVDYEGLNVRYISSGAKTGKVLPIATKVEVIKEDGNRAIITSTTYVDKNYLSKKCPNYKTVSGAKGGLNVRKGPGILYKKIAIITNGTKVKIYSNKGNWSKVSPDENCWCWSSYLK